MVLCLLLVIPMFLTSCAKEDEGGVDQEAISEGAVTVTLWMIYEDVATTDEEREAAQKSRDEVEKAFSAITKSKYKVNVDIKYLTEDEYYEKLEQTIRKSVAEEGQKDAYNKAYNKFAKAEKKLGNKDEELIKNKFFALYPEWERFRDLDDEEDTTVGEEETVRNENGVVEIKYPEAGEYQVDIIYLSGYDKYIEYIEGVDENSWLYPLNDELGGASKKINDYISSALLNGVKENGTTYAIPNNTCIGEYTYMMIDKEMFDACYGNYSEIGNILDCKNFLTDVKEIYPDAIPINSTFKECMDMFVWYWNIGYTSEEGDDVDEDGNPVMEYTYSIGQNNDFSVIGALYNGPESISRGQIELGFNSLFTIPEYRNIYLQLKDYEFKGYFGAEAAQTDKDARVAISFMKDKYAIKEEAEKNNGVCKIDGKEYYTFVVKYPEADEEALYGNMLGVCSYSKHLSASMKIITALNTSPELRNILQYGIEGINYIINDDGVLERLNNDYVMKVERTGNCFIAYPEEGQPANYWENAKKQNNEALINPLLGFSFNQMLDNEDKHLDNNIVDNLSKLSASVEEDILAQYVYEYEYEYKYTLDANGKKVYTLDADGNKIPELDENGNKVIVVDEDGNKVFALDEKGNKILKADETYAALTKYLNDDLNKNTRPMSIVKYTYAGEQGSINLLKLCNNKYDTANSDPNSPEPIEDTLGESPYTVYYNWLAKYGYLPAK